MNSAQHPPQTAGSGPRNGARAATRRLRVKCAVLTAPRLSQPVVTHPPPPESRLHAAGPSLASGATSNHPQPPALTPKRLEQLGAAFQLDVRAMQALLHRHPSMLHLEADAVHRQLDVLHAVFAVSREQAVSMVQLAPWLLLTPPAEVEQQLHRLVATLALPLPTVRQLCVRAPSVLRWEPAGFRGRLQNIAAVLEVPLEWVVQLGMEHTQLLSIQQGKAAKRLQRLVEVFGVEDYLVRELVAKHPRLLSTSPRIVCNKMKVVQSVLDVPWPQVARLVLREPELALTARQDNMRTVYLGIQHYLPCKPAFALQMALLCPRLLLTPWHVVATRMQRLQHLSSYSERWGAEWDALTPFQAASALDKAASRHTRLRFLVDGRMADKHSLVSVVLTDQAAFHQRYPGYRLWLQQQGGRG